MAKKRLSGAQQRKRKSRGLTASRRGRPSGKLRERQVQLDITHTIFTLEPEVYIAGKPLDVAKIEAMSSAERTAFIRAAIERGELQQRPIVAWPQDTKSIVSYLLSPEGVLWRPRLMDLLRKYLPERYANISDATLNRYIGKALGASWKTLNRYRE
jgi:hypothetical protein